MAPPERFWSVSSVQRVDFDPPGGVGSTPVWEPSPSVEARYGAEDPRGVSQDTRGVDGTNFEIEFWVRSAILVQKRAKYCDLGILGLDHFCHNTVFGHCRPILGLFLSSNTP